MIPMLKTVQIPHNGSGSIQVDQHRGSHFVWITRMKPEGTIDLTMMLTNEEARALKRALAKFV